jgi:hypothetical protein
VLARFGRGEKTEDVSLIVRTLNSEPAAASAPDVYFTSGYGKAEEVAANASWILLEDHRGLWQMPLMIRRMDSLTDAISPYGYSGVYAERLSARDLERTWASACSVLRDMHVTSIFLRRSPLVPQAPMPEGAVLVISGHATRALKVTSPDAMWADMESSCRNKVRKASKSGAVASMRRATEDDLADDSAFRSLYESTMNRRNAKDAYFFTADYYRQLLAGLGDALWVGEVQSAEGEVTASALFMRHASLLHYHLSGALPHATGAINLLIWTALQRAHEEGLELVHLGGGVEDGDSLYGFKKSFGGYALSYSAYGLILEQAEYDSAVERTARQLGTTSEQLRQTKMFPSYRARI